MTSSSPINRSVARPHQIRSIPLLALIMSAMLAAGCVNTATPVPATPETTPTDSTSGPTPTPELTPNVFEEMLGLVPDTPETRAQVRMLDHARLENALGLYPQSDESKDWQPELLRLQRTFLSFYEVLMKTGPNLQQYLALRPENVDQSLLAGVAPHQWEVLRGRFEPEATERALAECSGECIAPDAREEYQGVAFYSWGEDFKGSLRDRLKPPAFDRLGRGGRIAVQDKYIYRTLGTDEMKASIDASLGRRPSLADLEKFRIAARKLSNMGLYTMSLSDDTHSVSDLDSFMVTLTGKPGTYDWLVSSDENRRTYKVVAWDSAGISATVHLDSPLEEVQEMRQELEQSPLRPYQVSGVGRGLDADGGYIGIVLVHANEDLARENALLLRERLEETPNLSNSKPWKETIDLDKLEIWTKGELLAARLPLPDKEMAGGIPSFDTSYSIDALLLMRGDG